MADAAVLSEVNVSVVSLASQVTALKSKLDEAETNYNESLDTIWMLLAALLVFFMHAGFSLLEAGSVRYKSASGILAKNLTVVTLGFLCWYVLGYAFALGIDEDNTNKFLGSKGFFMEGLWSDMTQFRTWFFQGAFCATAATIVSGAMAERTKLAGFCVYTVLISSFIYPAIVYWGWSGAGLLNYEDTDGALVSIFGPGYMDFAGSGIVHMVGGVGALCGAIVVGAREGRFEVVGTKTNVKGDEEDVLLRKEAFAPHSIPFCVLGTFCLWFGWYGFNPGSTLSLHDKATATTAGLVCVNTTLAPCCAGLLVCFLRAKVFEPRHLDVAGFCNGILAGLVGITAGCAFVKPWEAILIGLIAGGVYQIVSMLVAKFKIDDVVDAFAVHGACGCWGVLSLGFFGEPTAGMGGNGIFHGGDQIRTQVGGVLLIAGWVSILSVSIFVPMRFLGLLRLEEMKLQSPGKGLNPAETEKEVDIEVCGISA